MTVRARDTVTAAPFAPSSVGGGGGDVPAALVVVLGVAVSLATVGGWLEWDVLRDRAGATGLLLVALIGGAGLVVTLRPRTTAIGRGPALVLAVPAASVVAAAMVGAWRGAPVGLEWFLNGDHPRHVVYVADTWAQGNLTYALDGYPRGWHALLGAVWSVLGAGLDGEHVPLLLAIMAAASLLLSAALALALAHVAYALATRTGLPARTAACVGVVTGALSLFNVFLANYQALGYENSVLGAVVVVVCCRELLVRAGSTVSLVVCAAGVIVVAHSWQLLLPPVGLAAVWSAGVALRAHEPLVRAALTVLVPGAFVMGAPGVLAVVSGVGLDHATEAGPESPVPVLLLSAGLLAVIVVFGVRRDSATACFAAVTVLPAVTASALAVSLRLDLLHYYPSKLLWQSAVLTLPWVVVLATMGVRLVVRPRRLAQPFQSAVAAFVGVVAAYALLLPWGSQLGTWSTVNGARVMGAVQAPGASEAVVVWLEGSPTTDSIARILLDALRVERTRSRAPQARMSVSQECAKLREAKRPVVLSTATEAAVRERYSCANDLVVLSVVPVR